MPEQAVSRRRDGRGLALALMIGTGISSAAAFAPGSFHRLALSNGPAAPRPRPASSSPCGVVPGCGPAGYGLRGTQSGGGWHRGSAIPLGILSLRAQRQGSTQSVDMAKETKEKIQSTVFKALGGLAVSIATAYCVYTGQNPVEVVQAIASADPQEVLQNSVEYIEGLGPLGYVYFSLIYIVAEMFAIPAVPLTASAGYLFGVVPGTCIVLFSATIAAGGAFIIGRLFLRDFIEGIISKSRKFLAVDEAISRKGFQLVLLLRLSPLLPFALSNYLYGMTKVNFFEYLAGTALGFAPGSIGFVMSGQVGRTLMGDEASGGGVPWYAYAGGIAAVTVIGKVVSEVAGKAIAEVEAEFDAKEAAKLAEEGAEGAADGSASLDLSDNEIEIFVKGTDSLK